MEFIAATNNSGKLKELRRILEQMGHSVISLKEADINVDVEETGTTFEENALIKAKTICEITQKPTIADDSGLMVDALNGEPGVFSARYCGNHGDDEANNDKLLDVMKNVPLKNRGAKFVSAVVAYMPNGKYFTAIGECHGVVGTVRQGNNGFGYDPIFNILQFDGKSYAQLTDNQKDEISHRGKALKNLQNILADLL